MANDKELLKRVIVSCFNRRGRGSVLSSEKIREEVCLVINPKRFKEYFPPAFDELVQDGHLEYMAHDDKYRLLRQLI